MVQDDSGSEGVDQRVGQKQALQQVVCRRVGGNRASREAEAGGAEERGPEGAAQKGAAQKRGDSRGDHGEAEKPLGLSARDQVQSVRLQDPDRERAGQKREHQVPVGQLRRPGVLVLAHRVREVPWRGRKALHDQEPGERFHPEAGDLQKVQFRHLRRLRRRAQSRGQRYPKIFRTLHVARADHPSRGERTPLLRVPQVPEIGVH